jgi:Na+-transporting NADH:ubiquinone oxidoreductase subunit NqrC
MKIDPPLYPYSSEPASAWSLMQTLVLVLVLALPATTLVDMEIEKYQQILLSTNAMMMDASKLMLAMAPLLLHYQLIEKTAQEEEEDRMVGMESIQNAKNFEYIEATT